MRTRHPIHILRRQLLARRDHGAAGEALHRHARLELGIERGAVIEDEAVARVMVAAHLFEILEDAAFELVHIVVGDVFCMWMAAFSQRMPPVQKVTAVVSNGDLRATLYLVCNTWSGR